MTILNTITLRQSAASLVAAGIGGFASMGFLRVFRDWAYRTEFKFWTFLTAVHCALIFILFMILFGVKPSPTIRSLAGRGLASVVLGGLIIGAWFPYGTVAVISGQAFITSFAATLAYVCLVFRDYKGEAAKICSTEGPEEYEKEMYSKRRGCGLTGLAVLCTCALLAWLYACPKYVQTTKEMTWDCMAGETGSSGDTRVRLRYVDAPAYTEYIENPKLCARLRTGGRTRVKVKFEVRGTHWAGLQGYRIDEIDGQAVDPQGPLGGSGREGESAGPHPLAAAFRRGS